MYTILTQWLGGGGSKPDKKKVQFKTPKGLYLYGDVGSGKTMLMDLFHDTCHVSQKHRVHFHEFMLDVHKSKYFRVGCIVFVCVDNP